MSFDPNGYVPRGLLTIVAAITGIGPYIADFNETHVYNPTWPGHAKFHNGQTMSMGVALALGTIWKTYFDNNDRLLTASVFASLYYITMISAHFYPGATAWDPPQFFTTKYPHIAVFTPNLVMVGLAYYLEQRRVGGLKAKTK